ncbi:MAG: hypothetical protein QF632_05250 [Candidatus Woesearchaeota archaeon]|jgi:hypothetical protein|nr:hypothetical protein [Candidatus Woesearchaeota archaeon]MDP7324138.1 hypothetical protein [Candidatus Woesearchaeota archaeon]MDP7458218.1 hypothetical protein [Candidatus Woesearchaeota archaeon]
MPKQVKKKEDLSLLAIVLIVLIVIGIKVILQNPLISNKNIDSGSIEQDKVGMNEEIKKSVISYESRTSTKGLAALAVCIHYKQSSDEQYETYLEAEEQYTSSNHNYYFYKMRDSKKAYNKNMEKYLKCIEHQ